MTPQRMRRRDRVAGWLRILAALIDGTAARVLLMPHAALTFPRVELSRADAEKIRAEFEKPHKAGRR